jgi:hypothetical protein
VSLKNFCWIFPGVIAAVYGWFATNAFVSAHGWNDPVGGVILSALLVWFLLGMFLWWVFLNLRPLSLIKEGGSFLFRLMSNDRPTFYGHFLPEEKLLKNFKLSDLFRRYTYFPAKITNTYQKARCLRLGSMVQAQIKNFCVKFNVNEDYTIAGTAMKLFYQYGNVAVLEEKIKAKIEKALEDALAETVQLAGQKMSLNIYWEQVFLDKVEEALKNEMYSYDSKGKAEITM